MNIPGYDAWRLAGPDDDRREIGTEDGQPCNRIHEPDDDAPRGHKPNPCRGEMIQSGYLDDDGYIVCNICGESTT